MTGLSLSRSDPRARLFLLVAYSLALFLANAWWVYLGLAAVGVWAVWTGRESWSGLRKIILPVAVLAAGLLAFHLVLTPGRPLFVFAGWQFTYPGLALGGRVALRLILLVMVAAAVSGTTSPVALSQAVGWWLKPLGRIGLPVADLSLMLGLALTFIPVIKAEADRLVLAQRARGIDLQGGLWWLQPRGWSAMLIPLLVGTVRRAENLALAMENRKFRPGQTRTERYQSQAGISDYLLAGAFLLLVVLAWVY